MRDAATLVKVSSNHAASCPAFLGRRSKDASRGFGSERAHLRTRRRLLQPSLERFDGFPLDRRVVVIRGGLQV